jgi:hypothetical protein
MAGCHLGIDQSGQFGGEGDAADEFGGHQLFLW